MSPAATIVTTLDDWSETGPTEWTGVGRGVEGSADDGEGIAGAATEEVAPKTTLVWEKLGSAVGLVVGVAFEQARTETARMTMVATGAPERLAPR